MIWTGLPSQLLLLHLHQLFILRRRPFSEVIWELQTCLQVCVCSTCPHIERHTFLFLQAILFCYLQAVRAATGRCFARLELLSSRHVFPITDPCLKKKPAMLKDTQQLAATNEQLATHSRSLAVSPSFGSMKPRSGESSPRTRPVCVCVHINQSVFYSEHGVWS